MRVAECVTHTRSCHRAMTQFSLWRNPEFLCKSIKKYESWYPVSLYSCLVNWTQVRWWVKKGSSGMLWNSVNVAWLNYLVELWSRRQRAIPRAFLLATNVVHGGVDGVHPFLHFGDRFRCEVVSSLINHTRNFFSRTQSILFNKLNITHFITQTF